MGAERGAKSRWKGHFEAFDELLLGWASRLLFVRSVRERMRYERMKGRKKSRRGDGLSFGLNIAAVSPLSLYGRETHRMGGGVPCSALPSSDAEQRLDVAFALEWSGGKRRISVRKYCVR